MSPEILRFGPTDLWASRLPTDVLFCFMLAHEAIAEVNWAFVGTRYIEKPTIKENR